MRAIIEAVLLIITVMATVGGSVVSGYYLWLMLSGKYRQHQQIYRRGIARTTERRRGE